MAKNGKTEEHADWAKAKPRKVKVKGKVYHAQTRVTKGDKIVRQ